MTPEARSAALANLRAGKDLVPSIILAVFSAWPCACILTEPGLCKSCSQYTQEAPEVAACNEFRTQVGTHILGSWSEPAEGSWCVTHTREEAVTIFEAPGR